MPATTAILAALLLAPTPKYDLRKAPEPIPGQPCARYFTHDRFGREITFYMTEAGTKESLPLVVFVQGSGAGSNFLPLENERIVPQNGQTSFLATSPLQELGKFKGRIYIGQGLEDAAVDYSSADALYAQLLAQGKDVVYDRVPGVDHSFSSPDDNRSQGGRDEMTRVATWFLGPPNSNGPG